MLFASLVILAVVASKECEGVSKRWIRTWDLDDPNNWQERKVPCGGKVASLPRRPDGAVFLGDRLTTASLDLPVEGQLILGNGANLVLDNSPQGECQDARWDHHGYDSWWDPDAWHHPNYEDPVTSPVPHVHRVPCTRDDVFFTNPNQSLYRVHLTPPVVTISSISIGNQGFSTSELAAYVRSKEGRFRFEGVSSQQDNAPLYIERPSHCADITGCLCGTEAAESRICHIMRSKCPQANCEDPIEMKGFCCKVCGAEVRIAHNGSLSLQDVRNLLRDHLATSVAEGLSAYSSKMDDNLYHVYFTAVNDQGDYKAASLAFKTKFEKELGAGGQHTTSLAYSGNLTEKARKGPSAHSVAAAFITLAVCLAIGLAVYYLRKRRVTSQLSFMFRRLESNSRRVSVISDVGGRRLSTTSSITPSYNRDGGLRFLNPIFNQSMASLVAAGLSERHPVSQTVPEDQLEGQHENPMYMAYENMSPEERQASEDTLRAQEGNGSALVMTSIVSTPGEHDAVQHGPPKSDLDVIIEEKDNCVDTGYDDSQAEKVESKSEVISEEQHLGTKETSDFSPEEENETEKFMEEKPKDALEAELFPLDIDSPGTEAEKENGLDIFGGEIFSTSDSTDVLEQSTSNPNTVEVEAPEIPDVGDNASASSSDDSLDLAMNMEGFTPMKDLSFGN